LEQGRLTDKAGARGAGRKGEGASGLGPPRQQTQRTHRTLGRTRTATQLALLSDRIVHKEHPEVCRPWPHTSVPSSSPAQPECVRVKWASTHQKKNVRHLGRGCVAPAEGAGAGARAGTGAAAGNPDHGGRGGRGQGRGQGPPRGIRTAAAVAAAERVQIRGEAAEDGTHPHPGARGDIRWEKGEWD
jgi:hypothetical protein